MMAPEMAAEAMRAYAEETNRLNRERRASGEVTARNWEDPPHLEANARLKKADTPAA
jgi:hypothetical protein